MSETELAQLSARFGEAVVRTKLDYGRNLQGWDTKYKSEYHTIKRWCEDDARKSSEDHAVSLTESSPEERRRRFMGGSLGAFVQSGESQNDVKDGLAEIRLA